MAFNGNRIAIINSDDDKVVNLSTRGSIDVLSVELIDANGDQVGYAVSTAGDVNGDGYADVMVGAPKDYTEEGIREGGARVFYGCAAGIYSPLVPDWETGSGDSGSYFGSAVATAGDVNHDGYADIIVGAPAYHSDEDQVGAVGAAFVYHGNNEPGVPFPAEPPPVSIGDIVRFFYQSYLEGSIFGVGSTDQEARRRVIIFWRMLTNSRDMIEQDSIVEACTMLNNAYLRSEAYGPPSPPDIINGTAKPELNDMIFELIGVLDCP